MSIALEWLDLHHIGTQVGEVKTSDRPRNNLGKLEHSDAGQGAVGVMRAFHFHSELGRQVGLTGLSWWQSGRAWQLARRARTLESAEYDAGTADYAHRDCPSFVTPRA